MAALDEVGYSLEDVGNLSHDPEPLLHQCEQLPVLFCCGTFLKNINSLTIEFGKRMVTKFAILPSKDYEQYSIEIRSQSFEMFKMI